MITKKIHFKILFITLIIALSFVYCKSIFSANNSFIDHVRGKILLQVEKNGEAWYINPSDSMRYFLGRPSDALDLMRNLGVGITNANLNKIPIGIANYDDQDNDNDGLVNRLEIALGTNMDLPDTDNDGFDDFEEIQANYDPLSTSTLPIDDNFRINNAGRIFLQVEANGEAWYINPDDTKRYYLGRASDAFIIMRSLGLGISDVDINRLLIKDSTPNPGQKPIPDQPNDTEKKIIELAATAIRQKNSDTVFSYFTSGMEPLLKYVLDNLDQEQCFELGNILSGAKLSSATDSKKIYTNEIYFSLGGYKVPMQFIVERQTDGEWLLTNL